MWIFIATAMSKTQAAQGKLESKAQRRENCPLSPQGTIKHMKMARRKAVKKFSWTKNTVKAKTDSSQASANKRKKNYVSNQVLLPQCSPSVTCWDITQGSAPNRRHGDSPLHSFFCPDASRGTTHAPLHPWALLGTVPLMETGDCSEGERGTISSYCSLSEQREQQRDSAHPFWCLCLPEPSQKLSMSLSIQKHELQFIIKSATSGWWMRGAPKHCLIYFCAAQNLDTERGLWNVSKMIIVFFAKTAKSFLASKKHLGDRNK